MDVEPVELIYFGDFGLVEYYIGMQFFDDPVAIELSRIFDDAMDSLGWEPIFCK